MFEIPPSATSHTSLRRQTTYPNEMGSSESKYGKDPPREVSFSNPDDAYFMDTYIKTAAVRWTRIAKAEDFQMAFVGATAAVFYGSSRATSRLDVLVEENMVNDDGECRLLNVVKRNKDELAVLCDNTILVKVDGNKGVALNVSIAATDSWGNLVPARQDERMKYYIPSLAIPTYGNMYVILDNESIPILFAHVILLQKLRTYSGYVTLAERQGEFLDIMAAMEFMLKNNIRLNCNHGAGYTHVTYLRDFLAKGHHNGLLVCDINMVNKWRRIGFRLGAEDCLTKGYYAPAVQFAQPAQPVIVQQAPPQQIFVQQAPAP